MKLFFQFTVMVVLFSISESMYSQNSKQTLFEVFGIVKTQDSVMNMSGTNVVLVKTDSKSVQGTSSNRDGSFSLAVNSGTYSVTVTFVGYEDFTSEIKVQNEALNLGEIVLKESALALEEVVVEQKIPPVVQKNDTTQYNALAYKTNPDATAENLLEKMPGIVITDGKLQAQGEDVKKVLIDGKPFFDNDPNAAIKNLPAEVIQKIQLYDEQSELARLTGFDDGEYEKTINIITKPEYREGVFGNATAGYGTNNRYQVSGVANIFNDDQRITVLAQSNNINQQNFSSADLAGVSSSSGGRGGGAGGARRGGGRRGGGGRAGGGADVSSSESDFLVGEQNGIVSSNAFGINYSDSFNDKMELASSYFFNQSENDAFTQTSRSYFNNNAGQQDFVEEAESGSINTNHRLNLQLRYTLDDKNSLVFKPKFTSQTNDGFNNATSTFFTENGNESTVRNNTRAVLDAYNFTNSVLWQHKFEKKGRSLAIDFGQQINTSTGDNNVFTDYSDANDQDIDQISTLDQQENTAYTRISFTEPLWESALLRLNYRPSITFSEIDKQTFDKNEITDAYDLLNSNLSNQSYSEFFSQQAGASVLMRSGQSNFILSSAMEWSSLTNEETLPNEGVISKNYTNFLPSFIWRWRINKSKNIRLNIRSTTSIPKINQLQEVLDNSNPLNQYIGNGDLDQQKQTNASVRYSSTNSESLHTFYVLASANLVQDYIGDYIFLNNTDASVEVENVTLSPGSQLTRPVNFDQQFNTKVFSSYGFPVDFIKSNLNFNATAQYANTPSLVNDVENEQSDIKLSLGVVLSSNISENIDFTLSSNSSYQYTTNSTLSNSITRQFIQKSKLRLSYTFLKDFVLRSDLNHSYFGGLEEGIDPDYLLWNINAGMKFLKDNRGELSLTMFDVLGENTSLVRNTTDTYFEDVRNNVLEQYFMLSFTYKFRGF
ncbi:outer membrane beta-barrel protein [Galbibacter mesophilus]|uniref:outer membrane beta-barrel protein n=1 Tax=Galbibacter mesophilus TaxID=379069 RepID=UPI00191DAA3A|nr:outer membrane beta-barrel protein [Galbibacter mesophilus]MCM5663010.1 outer membrane beta-barrel protein [Galbibacter mesophilus]